MAKLNIAPTKSNQIALKRDLNMATQGFSLLEQKREILVMEMMHLMDKVKEVQQEMTRCSQKAYATLRQALALNGYQNMLNIASGIEYQRELTTSARVSAGVRIPSLEVTQGEFQSKFGFVGTNSLVDSTMEDFLKLVEATSRLASLETSVWLLARELKKTQRRVNALEHIFIPNYKDTLHFIGESLEEKELESFFTMKMVKKKLEKRDAVPEDETKGGA